MCRWVEGGGGEEVQKKGGSGGCTKEGRSGEMSDRIYVMMEGVVEEGEEDWRHMEEV